MATNALTYIKNVGKSVAYASVDVAKKMNPVFADFAETNGELVSDSFKAIKSIKKNAKDIPNKVMESQYGQFAKTYGKNLMDDIKTGKFYNKERIARDEVNAMGNMFGGDSDFDFESGESADDFNFESSSDEFSNDGPSTNEMIDIVGEKTSTAVSTAVARSAEYIVQGTAEQNRALYNQMNLIYGGIHTGMSTINQNISKIIEFSTDVMATHFENSRTYYQESTRLDQERNALLKELVDNVKEIASPVKKDNIYESTKYSDIASIEGNVDIKEYAKFIKQNIKNKSGLGGAFDMVKFFTDSGMLETLASSPISGTLELALTKLIPKTLEKSMKSFNDSVSGLFSNMLMTLKEKSGGGGIWDLLSGMFGFENYLDKRIDPSRYEKGKVPFDGITRKAIVEVIPTYLSKILTALTGKKENRFDYDTGKFVTVDRLNEKLRDIERDSAHDASRELDEVVRNKRSKVRFRNKADEEQFDKDWEAVRQYLFVNQKRFNTRDKNLSGKDFGLKGGIKSDINVKLLQRMLDGTSENMKYADQLYRAVDSFNSRMREHDSSSVLNALFNGSVDSSDAKSAPASGVVARANESVISELVAIHKELSYIRIYGAGGGYRSGNNVSGGPGPQGGGPTPPKFENFSVRSSVKDTKEIIYNKNFTNTKQAQYKAIKDVKDTDKIVDEMLSDSKDDFNSNTKKKTFSQRMNAAAGLSGKMAVIVESATDLAKKPAKFIGAMFDKADERLYDIIYGPKEDKTGKKSFLARLLKQMEGLFNKFSDFMTDSIIEPLKGKFTKENIHDAAKKFFGIFGIDMDEMVRKTREFLFGKKNDAGERLKNGIFGKLIDDTRSNLESAFGWVKKSFSDVGDWIGVTSKKNSKGLAKEKSNEFYKNKADSLDSLIAKSLTGNVAKADEHATGMRRVNKTGLAVISEGEMIIPPDMNPFNISKRRRNEKNVKKQVIDKINNAFEYGEGTSDATSGKKLTKEEIEELKIKIIQRNPDAAQKLADVHRSKIQKFDKSDYEDGRNPLIDRVAEQAGSAAYFVKNQIVNNMGISEKDKEKFQQNATKFIGNVKEYGGSMAAGGILGAGVSLMTGLIGGPLVGAAVGAGVGLLQKSEFLQNALFGEFDENGERKGSKFISKDLANNIHKYLPDMGKGATVGGILTALPFVPGGPVAGIIVGSALGFAKNNDQVQQYLFGNGEEGSKGILGTKEGFQKKLQSVLPKMGLGAIAGVLGGPFGLTANIVLGSALGFASDTNKFKDLMFGKEVDGKRTGGIFGAVTKPATEFFKNMYSEFKDFIKNDIFQPVADAIAPIKRQFEVIGESVSDFLKRHFNEKIGAPLERFLKERVIDPIGGFIKTVIGAVTKPIKFIVSAPFKTIGAIGNALRARQIKRGNADYMTAAERNAFRASRGKKTFAYGDRYKDLDQSLENIDNDQMNLAAGAMDGIIGARGKIDKLKYTSHENVRQELYKKGSDGKYTVSRSDAELAMRFIKAGSYEQAMEFIKNNKDINQVEKRRLLSIIAKESATMKTARRMREDADGTIDSVVDTLESQGIKLPKNFREKLKKGDREAIKVAKYISNEQKARQGKMPIGEAIQKSQEEGTTKIVDSIEKIYNLLAKLNGIDSHGEINSDSKYAQQFEQQLRRNNQVSGIEDDTGFIMRDENGNEIHQEVAPGEDPTLGDYARKGRYYFKKGVKGTFRGIKKGLGFTKRTITSGAKAIRNTKTMNTILGDKNTYWRKGARKLNQDEEVAAVSKDEIIVSADDIKNGKEYSVGGVSGGDDKKNSFFSHIKDIATNIKRIAGAVTGMALHSGIDTTNIDEDKESDNYIDAVENKVKKASNTVTQFVNGKVFKFRKDKNGDMELDKSSAENKESQQELEEEQEVQRGILDTLKSIPSKIGSFFGNFFKDDDDEEGMFSKLWNKISGPLTTVVGGTALAAGAGYVITNYGDDIRKFWDEKVVPYFNDAWNGKKDGLGQFIYFFNPVNPNGLLNKAKSFFENDFPVILDYLSQNVGKAMQWIITDILPGAVESAVELLPSIIGGLGKGLWNGITGLWDSFWNKKDKDKGNNDGAPPTAEEVFGSEIVQTVSSATLPSVEKPSFLKDMKSLSGGNYTISYTPSSNSSVLNSIGGQSNVISNGINSTPSNALLSNYNNSLITNNAAGIPNQQGAPKYDSNFIPVGLTVVEGKYGKDSSRYKKYSEELKRIGNNIIATPYGNMTIYDVLNSDLPMVTFANGQRLSGKDMLLYPEFAEDLGFNPYLTDEEMDENENRLGYSTLTQSKGEKFVGSSMRAAHRGFMGFDNPIIGTATKITRGIGKGIGAVGRFIDKIPLAGLVGKPTRFLGAVTRAGSSIIDNTVGLAGKAGKHFRKDFDEAMAKRASEKASKTATEQATKAAKEAAENMPPRLPGPTSNVEDAVEKIKDVEILDADGNVITSVSKEATETATEQATKAAKEATKDATEKAAKDGLKDGAKALNGAADDITNSKLKKILNNIKNLIDDVLNSKVVQNLLKPAIKALGSKKLKKEGTEGIIKIISKKAKEIIGNIFSRLSKAFATKLAKTLGKFLTPVGWAWMVYDVAKAFNYGYENANTILGTIEQPDLIIRCLCGLLQVICNEIFLGLITAEDVMPMLINLLDAIGVDMSGLEEQRKEDQAFLDQENKENDTNLTIAQYNEKHNKKTWFSKVDGVVTKAGSWIGDKAKSAGSWVLDKAKGIGGGIKDAGSWLWDKAKGIGGGIKDAGSWVLDKAKGIGSGIKDAGSWVWDKAGDVKDWTVDKVKGIGSGIKNAGSWLWDKAKGIGSGIKDAGSWLWNKAGDAKDWAVDKAKGIGSGIKDAGSWLWDKGGDAVDWITGGVSDLVNKSIDGINSRIAAAKDLGKYASDVVKSTIKEMLSGKDAKAKDIEIDKDDPYKSQKEVIHSIIKAVAFLPGQLIKGGKLIYDKGLKPLIEDVISVGKGVGTTTTSLFTKAWEGDVFGAFAQNDGAVGIKTTGVKSIASIISGVIKVAMAVPTLLTSGVGLVVRNFDGIVSGLKTIGSGIAGTASSMIKSAWDGELLNIGTEAMNENTANTDNSFVNGASKVANLVTTAVMAIPSFLTFSVKKIIDAGKVVFDGIVTVGSGLGKTVGNYFTNAWNGDISAMLKDTSGNADSGNGLVDGASAVVNTASKVVLALPALITSGIGLVVRNFDDIIGGIKTIGSAAGDMIGDVMSKALKGKNPLGEIFTTENNAHTGNKLIDGISAVLNGAIKIPLTPIALITTAVNFIANKIKDFTDLLSKAGELSDADEKIMEDAAKGDVNPFTGQYWKYNNNKLDGVAKGINQFVTLMRKVFNLPAALIAWLNPINLIEKGSNWIKDKLGLVENDEYVSSNSNNGRGSGLYVGRGNNTRSSELKMQREAKKSQNNEFRRNQDESKQTFISQIDSRYRDKRFNISGDTERQTIGDTGCAPAAAAMVVNSTTGTRGLSMDQAVKNSLPYKVKNDGVNATYFNDEFARHGVSASYITSQNVGARKQEIIRNLINNNKVVLMGSDQTNRSKGDSPYGPNPHYVVANGLSKDGKYIYINDPESRTPNVKYRTDKVLNHSDLGIAAHVASGSKLLSSKIKKYVGRGKYGPDTIQYQVWNGLRNAGYNEIATAAAMGNIEHESAFDPDLVEKGSGIGYGLVQWSFDRRTAFESYAASKGKPASDLSVQIEYLLKELEPNSGVWTGASSAYGFGSLTRDDWANGKDLDTATKAFMTCFERPSYDPGTNHIDRRLVSSREYYEAFVGTPITPTGFSTSSSTSGSTSTGGTIVDKMYGLFTNLAAAYGLTTGGTTDNTLLGGTNVSGTASGNVSSDPAFAEKQRSLVNKMYEMQGKLDYAQGNEKWPGERKAANGVSSDCSETVQYVYKSVLGVDPGDYTGAQEIDDDTYTVATSTADESKLQLGDLLLKHNHVEMYSGNGKMIGHGGPGKGPTEKALDQSGKYYLVRRWTGFKGTGSGLPVGRGSEVAYNGAYDNALRHINNEEYKSLLPEGYDAKEISDNKYYTMQYRNNKLSDSTVRDRKSKPVYAGRGTSSITNIKEDTVVVKGNNKSSDNSTIVLLLRTILAALKQMVDNTGQLNEITRLLGEYITATETNAKSKNKQSNDSSKSNLINARQNLINAINSRKSSSDGANSELMELINLTERIAKQ